MAMIRPDTLKSRQRSVDMERGRRRLKTVPCPNWLSNRTSPPRRSMVYFTTSSPTPRPEIFETSLWVVTPDSKRQSKSSSLDMSFGSKMDNGIDLVFLHEPLLFERSPDLLRVDSAAVIGDGQFHGVTDVPGHHADTPLLALSGLFPRVGVLNAILLV